MRLIVFALFLAAIVGCKPTPQSNSDDQALGMKLVGTWLNAPADKQPFISKTTYRSDGTGVERVWPSGQSESAAVQVDTRWTITNGILCIVSVKSSDPQKIPVGIQLKDRIISISDAELIFQPLEGYDESAPRRVTRKRIRDGF